MSSSLKHILIQVGKVLIFLLLFIVLFYAGLMIGYGVVGDGKPTDALDKAVWTHITDFLEK